MLTSSSKTVYGSPLPHFLVDYRSKESKTRLCRALRTGYAVPYVSLSSCYNTQTVPTHSGVSTLAIILNALRIDPQRKWSPLSSWRWYTAKLLFCCGALEVVRENGTITLDEFVSLANCNGAVASAVRPNYSKEHYDEFTHTLERVCTGGKQSKEELVDGELPEELMAISFSRVALGQVGEGHFSPIAAMDKESNSVLIFETARYKYPPYWAPIEVLFQSMLPLDSVTGKSRGYVVLKAKQEWNYESGCVNHGKIRIQWASLSSKESWLKKLSRHFYRRRSMSTLSSKTVYGSPLSRFLVDYRSKESETRLCRALQTGYAVPYLSLSSCYDAQSEPSYCGVSTLAIILNALRIDPQRKWSPMSTWRWYTVELLDCCYSLEEVKKSGINLDEFVYLANCNGAAASVVRPNYSKEHYDEFTHTLERVCTGGKQSKEELVDGELPEELMAISFSRVALGQVGEGHFSPIAAMDKESNSVLIFETARYKYPPYWAPIEVLFQSMLPLDSVTGKSRGYVVLKAKHEWKLKGPA